MMKPFLNALVAIQRLGFAVVALGKDEGREREYGRGREKEEEGGKGREGRRRREKERK